MNNLNENLIFPLPSGISLHDIKLKVSKNIQYHTTEKEILYFNFIIVEEHPSDCGCLIIGNLDYITESDINKIEKFASLSGYSKIIGTIRALSNDKWFIRILKEAKYKFIDTGPSNRHPEYNTWLIYKVIKPELQGYV